LALIIAGADWAAEHRVFLPAEMRDREQAGRQASSGSQSSVMPAGRSAAGRVTGNLPGKRELP